MKSLKANTHAVELQQSLQAGTQGKVQHIQKVLLRGKTGQSFLGLLAAKNKAKMRKKRHNQIFEKEYSLIWLLHFQVDIKKITIKLRKKY